jgi:hypothetical protein
MIQVTEQAATLLREQLSQQDTSEGQAFRFVDAGEGQVGLGISPPQEGDVEIRHEEQPVLYVPSELASTFDNATVDVAPTQDGVGLVFRPSTDASNNGVNP